MNVLHIPYDCIRIVLIILYILFKFVGWITRSEFLDGVYEEYIICIIPTGNLNEIGSQHLHIRFVYISLFVAYKCIYVQYI